MALTIASLKERWKLTAIGAAALLALPPVALAQDAQPKPPADVNQPQTPAQPVTPPAAPVENAQPAAVTPPPPSEAPSSTATAEDGAKYAVSRFVLEYRTEHPQHPPIDDVLGATVKLGVVPDGYVAYREGLPSATVRIGEVVEGNGGTFYRSALNAVARSIVEEMNRQGFIGIFVQLNPEDIDETSGADLRAGQRSELRMIIWTGIVKNLRTIASGDRLKSAVDEGKIQRVNPDDPLHKRIHDQSPVQEGDLIRKDAMDDFVFRLNRHPGRRVDIAIDPGETPEEVVVDYLVTENKPWSVYFQLSNTGTESTSVWRERVGYVNNQLTGHDDVLRLDFITAAFDSSIAFTANYEFPVLSDRIHARVYASYSDFTASDVGFAQENFTGTTIAGGGEFSGTFYQHKELFLDAVGGLRWENVKVNNTAINSEGQDNFLIPYAGVKLDRLTETSVTYGSAIIEYGTALGGGQELQNLGRVDVDESWITFKYDVEQSFYLEPLFAPSAFHGERPGGHSLANEINVALRGQYAFGYRLIPNEEEVAGGMFSVRGYPESITAGDNAYMGSLEYRYHLPRALSVREPSKLWGEDFRWAPQQAYGAADWDLIFKAFIDAGRTTNSSPITGENDHTLVGAGVGTELQIKRNLSMRLDLGFALQDVKDEAQTVNAGDARLHFSVTVLY